MKIVGFAQIRNELSNGNLDNWLRSMDNVCDVICVIDQASNDGTRERLDAHPTIDLIANDSNDFVHERQSKGRLMRMLHNRHGDADWIFWLDGDTILDGRFDRSKFEMLCSTVDANGARFRHFNLWRSDVYYRVDRGLSALDCECCALWRYSRDLSFKGDLGIHLGQVPNNYAGETSRWPVVDCALLHRGFATNEAIIRKFLLYWEIDPSRRRKYAWRLLGEEDLSVEHIDEELLPSWFNPDRTDPRQMESLKNLYKWKLPPL